LTSGKVAFTVCGMNSPTTTDLSRRARDVAVEILRTCDGRELLTELIALAYLQGRIEVAQELRRGFTNPSQEEIA
jgi:hypothetical protein